MWTRNQGKRCLDSLVECLFHQAFRRRHQLWIYVLVVGCAVCVGMDYLKCFVSEFQAKYQISLCGVFQHDGLRVQRCVFACMTLKFSQNFLKLPLIANLHEGSLIASVWCSLPGLSMSAAPFWSFRLPIRQDKVSRWECFEKYVANRHF